jgi:hypothetical protein
MGGKFMELKEIINGPGLWIASSFTVFAVIVQSIIFLKAALKEAKRLGMPKEQYIGGMRSAMITAFGPSLSPIIILMSLITVVGAPTAWMRLCDIGAARTELAMVTVSSNLLGIDPLSPAFNIKAFTYSMWGMALNNLGWIVVALVLTHRMTGIVDKLYKKYDPKWIKFLLFGANIGLFSYLLNGQLVGKLTFKPDAFVAAIVAGATFFAINKVFKDNQRLQELALGLSMLSGMLITNCIVIIMKI